MTLQNKIIYKYRQFFPNDNLREVSARTGIQITRVFRLLNGKPMKVGELEAFEKAINLQMNQKPQYSKLNHMMDQAAFLLSNEEMEKISIYFERKIENRKLQNSFIQIASNNESIA